jgi:hypothetical protein
MGSEQSQELPDRVIAFNTSSTQNSPRLPNGVSATESTDGAATNDHQCSSVAEVDEGPAMGSTPPPYHRGDPSHLPLTPSGQTNWDVSGPGTPTPSASQDHISALYLNPEEHNENQSVPESAGEEGASSEQAEGSESQSST